MNVTRACCANTTQRSKAHSEQYHSSFCMTAASLWLMRWDHTGQILSATSANFFCLLFGNSPSHGGRKGVRRKKWQLTQKSATLTCESQKLHGTETGAHATPKMRIPHILRQYSLRLDLHNPHIRLAHANLACGPEMCTMHLCALASKHCAFLKTPNATQLRNQTH